MTPGQAPASGNAGNNFAQDATLDFCRSVLGIHSKRPTDALRELTDVWLNLSDATWVWIWLKNTAPKINQWELVCDGTRDQASDAAHLPRDLTMPSDCLSQYSTAKKEVLIVDDLEGTRHEHEGQVYRCGIWQELVDKGAKTLIVVPFLAVDPGNSQRGIVGSICLHYRDRRDEVLQRAVLGDLDLLKLMGKMTAHVLRASFQFKYHSILVELNDIASEYLARFGRTKESRSDYLNRLIRLIQHSVHVRYVSVFYQQPFTQSVECLATTGLFQKNEQGNWLAVAKDQEPTVRYAAREGLTGECYATGETYQKPSKVAVEHPRKYVELRDAEGDLKAFLLTPILPTKHSRSGGASGPKAKGVIRVAGHTARSYRDHYRGHDRNFNSIELETIRFIAAQIAPVLETFNARIQREHSVGIIKHELYAPLKMIRDTFDQVVDDLRTKGKARQLDLEDISASCLFAENLVPQLSEDPIAASPPNFQKTFLEGDIVARVKDMLSHYAREAKDLRIEFGAFRDKQNPARSIPPLTVDPVLVERVLCNLIINAIKYGQKGTTILVDPFMINTTDADQRPGVYIEVSNYGIGIEPDEQRFIFEPYYRTRQAKTVAQGAGLGLTIASQIMAQHGGHLKLIRRTDPTIFQIFFPQSLMCQNRSEKGGR